MSRKKSGKLRVPSKIGEAVWIETGHYLWSKLPPATIRLLLAGLERIAEVRSELGQSAKVELPPVQIQCELWLTEDMSHTISGRAGPVRYLNSFLFGAELSAHICTAEDRSLLRALLVHEFLHVFHYAQLVVDELPGATVEFGPHDPFCAEDDDAALAKPEDWFIDPQDWEVLRHGHDERMSDGFDPGVLLLVQDLPRVMPQGRFHQAVTVPVEWLEHAQSLRGS